MENKKKSIDFNPYNINLIEAIQRINERSAEEDNAIGYYLPGFINTPLPHSQPESNPYRRYNGNSIMKLVADPDYGFPYAGRSRLMIAWMISSLYRQYNVYRKSGMERNQLNHDSRLIFKGTIEEMLLRLGYDEATGGDNGSITQVKHHLLAIINTQYKWTRKDTERHEYYSRDKFLFTINDHIYWCEHRWGSTEHSYIEMTPTLLHLIRSKADGFAPFPIDIRVLSALRDSPMAMDLYCWLTMKMKGIIQHPKRHECFNLDNDNRHRFIYSWKALKPQFGEGFSRTSNFTNKAPEDTAR